jgi:hypothetical protein
VMYVVIGFSQLSVFPQPYVLMLQHCFFPNCSLLFTWKKLSTPFVYTLLQLSRVPESTFFQTNLLIFCGSPGESRHRQMTIYSFKIVECKDSLSIPVQVYIHLKLFTVRIQESFQCLPHLTHIQKLSPNIN